MIIKNIALNNYQFKTYKRILLYFIGQKIQLKTKWNLPGLKFGVFGAGIRARFPGVNVIKLVFFVTYSAD
jgi:hypothetical protein